MAISKKIIISISYFLMGGLTIIAMFPHLVVDEALLIFCYALSNLMIVLFMVHEMNTHEDRAHIIKIRDFWLKHLLVLYCLMLVNVLIFNGTHRNGFGIGMVEVFSKEHLQRCNIIPFHTLVNYISKLKNDSVDLVTVIKNIFGNIALFMPLGFFFCTLFKKQVKSWLSCMIYTLLISFLFEILQFVTLRGISDIDDVLLNCMGSVVAYLFFKSRLFRRIDAKQYFCS